MEPIKVTAFEIIFHSWALSNGEDFGTIKTFISAKGIIRTTFERGIKYSKLDTECGHSLPVSVRYDYKLGDDISSIFREFDLLQLKPASDDYPPCDGGEWKMTIYTTDGNVKLYGYAPPEPFGKELADRIYGLLNYELIPTLFL